MDNYSDKLSGHIKALHTKDTLQNIIFQISTNTWCIPDSKSQSVVGYLVGVVALLPPAGGVVVVMEVRWHITHL